MPTETPDKDLFRRLDWWAGQPLDVRLALLKQAERENRELGIVIAEAMSDPRERMKR